MKHPFLLPFVAAGALLSVGFVGQAPRTIKEVTLERQPCFGTCPVYTVTIKSDGTVVYHGERFVERTGDYTARVWTGNLDRLGPMLDKLGFWKMKRSYDVSVTDQSTQIVKIVSDRGAKTVSEYGHRGPDELWAIQTLIDGLVANARDWKRIDKKPVR